VDRFDATGTLNLPTGTLNVSGSVGNYNGGNVSLSGNKLLVNGGGSFNLLASGTGNGNGGTVSLDARDADLTIGTAAGNISVAATGGSFAAAEDRSLWLAGFRINRA